MSLNEAQLKSQALILLSTNAKEAFSESMFDLWMELIEQYTIGAVHFAVKKIIENYPYRGLPPFSEMKKYLVAYEGFSQDELEKAALSEWADLLEKVVKFGRNNPPDLHPTTKFVVKLFGGWRNVCSWEEKDLDRYSKTFIQRWKESHGHVEDMEKGACGMMKALAEKRQKSGGPVQIGALLGNIPIASGNNAAA